MGLTVEEAAAGMYRVACNNMAQGVREVTIKRGYDPREFPFIAAGGAGPIHSCLICNELEIPLQIVPRSSSVLCAFGMLLSRTEARFRAHLRRAARRARLDAPRRRCSTRCDAKASTSLAEERIAAAQPPLSRPVRLPLYQAVSRGVVRCALRRRSSGAIRQPSRRSFHAEHNRLYGYSLEAEKTPIELINVRVQAIGATEKPRPRRGALSPARMPAMPPRAERRMYIPETERLPNGADL